MSSVRILRSNGSPFDVDRYAIECPFCHSNMTPEYLCYHSNFGLFARCSNTGCGKYMVLSMDSQSHFTKILPNSAPGVKVFSKTILEVSPNFGTIYNQAFCAEQLSLDQICGVGYRKALEFLIKDYLISGLDDEAQKENIKKKFLSKCIQDDVSDERIKSVAKRAVWLGNDETHYVRKWADKDVSNLKQLIDLTVRWIEMEVESRRLLEEMPE